MADMLFYERIALLDAERHRNLRVAEKIDYRFAAEVSAVPVVVAEFSMAAMNYPLFFANSPTGETMAVAMLGLATDENLFVDGKGEWDASYIPAFVRRYPFAPGAQAEGDELPIYVDEASSLLGETEGDPLFDDHGQASERLTGYLELLKDFQEQNERTRAFINRLKGAQLLKESNASINLADGGKVTVPGMLVVDEERLLALPDQQVMALFRVGELSLIYLHLASMANLYRLVERRSKRQARLVLH
ncbi:SapC family protein [Endothiovibrio diazotrophicus]